MTSKQDAVRIVILGNPGVGKSEGVYKHTLTADLENIDEQSETFSLEIMDTAGCYNTNEDLSKIEGYIRWADAHILVYSVTDSQSFEAMKIIKNSINEIKKTDGAVAVVGNKTDLEHMRQVETLTGRAFAGDHSCLFYEASARMDYEFIKRPFLDVCRNLTFKKTTNNDRVRRRSSASKLLWKLIHRKPSL